MLTPGSIGRGLGARDLSEEDISTRPRLAMRASGYHASLASSLSSSRDLEHPYQDRRCQKPAHLAGRAANIHRTGRNASHNPGQNSGSTLCFCDPKKVPHRNQQTGPSPSRGRNRAPPSNHAQGARCDRELFRSRFGQRRVRRKNCSDNDDETGV